MNNTLTVLGLIGLILLGFFTGTVGFVLALGNHDGLFLKLVGLGYYVGSGYITTRILTDLTYIERH